MKNLTRLIAGALLIGLLAACKGEATLVLPKVCANFPDSEIFKFDNRVLWIQTKISGVSAQIAGDMFQQGCRQAIESFAGVHVNIATELNFDGRQILIVGLKRFCIIWEVRNGTDGTGVPRNYQVLDWPQAEEWMTRHLGHMPTPDKIRVITLQDLQSTSKTEPLHLQTLAEIQQQEKEQLQQRMPEASPPPATP